MTDATVQSSAQPRICLVAIDARLIGDEEQIVRSARAKTAAYVDTFLTENDLDVDHMDADMLSDAVETLASTGDFNLGGALADQLTVDEDLAEAYVEVNPLHVREGGLVTEHTTGTLERLVQLQGIVNDGLRKTGTSDDYILILPSEPNIDAGILGQKLKSEIADDIEAAHVEHMDELADYNDADDILVVTGDAALAAKAEAAGHDVLFTTEFDANTVDVLRGFIAEGVEEDMFADARFIWSAEGIEAVRAARAAGARVMIEEAHNIHAIERLPEETAPTAFARLTF